MEPVSEKEMIVGALIAGYILHNSDYKKQISTT